MTTVKSAGILLLEEDFQPIAFNSAAVQILAFPTPPDKIRQPEIFLRDRVRLRLLKQNGDNSAQFVAEYRSGGRHYLCRAFRLDGSGLDDSPLRTALVLERHASFADMLGGSLGRFDLTPREMETVRYLVEGLTSKEIAERMRISPNTVKAFLRIVMVKMDCSTRSGIVGRIVEPRS
jgi:DNA-binding CsgD family transcriptional regulator